jgi:hypothetical protein
MTDPAHDPEQYAVVPVPPPGTLRDAIMANAVFTGGPLTDYITGLSAREESQALLGRIADAMAQLEAKGSELDRRNGQAHAAMLQDLCDGIGKMATRLDAYARREAARRRQERADARRALLDTLPSEGEFLDGPQHGEHPFLTDPDPPPNASRDQQMPDPGKEPEPGLGPELGYFDADPDLPSGMGTSGVPGEGTEPQLPEELTHPQPSRQTPSAIGGP